MIVSVEQLYNQLSAPLSGIIWIASDEPLVTQELLDELRRAAKQQGYEDRQRFFSGPRFDWSEVLASANSLSLFSTLTFLDIQHQGSFDDAFKKAVTQLAEAQLQDTLIIIQTDKLDNKQLKSKWVKAIEEASTVCTVKPVYANQFSGWLNQRAQKCGLSLSPQAVEALAEKTEGNLLAAAQEVEKLALFHHGKTVEIEDVVYSVADSARYNVFNLIDRLLEGDAAHALKTLSGLKAEGNDTMYILWALTREIRTLIQVKKLQQAQQDNDSALMRLGVMKMRSRLVRNAAQRIPFNALVTTLELCEKVDTAAKSGQPDSANRLIFEICTALAGRPTALFAMA
ncbi:MAG: DNA polymerase III subunit delta [Gammaproteobacteria bacterium]|nr:DNA polymerase III subunit delta [Gammaproteobacteria bacterium]